MDTTGKDRNHVLGFIVLFAIVVILYATIIYAFLRNQLATLRRPRRQAYAESHQAKRPDALQESHAERVQHLSHSTR